MRCLSLVFLLLIGCSQSLGEQAERSEQELERLTRKTDQLREELTDSRAALTQQIAEVDGLLVKLDSLLRPQPNPQPLPAPKPLPVPVPDAGPVDGRFQLARAVYRIGMAVPSPDRVAEAHALAGVFAGVASQVQAGSLDGTLLNPQWKRIAAALASGNKPILAKNFAVWDSPAKQLGDAIGQRYSQNRLSSNQDWADMLNEIALGLNAVS